MQLQFSAHRFAAIMAVGVIFLSGCSTTWDEVRSVAYQTAATAGQTVRRFSDDSYWDDDEDVPGKPNIVISLSEQKAYFYRGKTLLGVSIVSSGREGYRTRTGNFRIRDKREHHRSSIYGDYVDSDGDVVVANVNSRKSSPPPGTRYLGASMPYFMRFDGGIGMHAGYLPGYPASHGCVRMPEDMAEEFFEVVKIGTPVKVVR